VSSNHKAPLAAFVVVAIACVVVLATNSMRSYARDAWSNFAAPVVSGLLLVQVPHETPDPSEPSAVATSAAPVVEAAQVKPVHDSPHPVDHRPHHAAHVGSAVKPAVHVEHHVSAPPTPAVTTVTTDTTSHAPGGFGGPAHSNGNGHHYGWGTHGAPTGPAVAPPPAMPVAASHDNGHHYGWGQASPGNPGHSSPRPGFSHGPSTHGPPQPAPKPYSYSVAASIAPGGPASHGHGHAYGQGNGHAYGHGYGHH
jgi:hypothetical protein